MAVSAESLLDEGAFLALVVDLDGTLVRSDLLAESAFVFLGTNPLRILDPIRMLAHGKAALKAGLAAASPIYVTNLPYDERVLELIAQATGDHSFLCCLSHEFRRAQGP